MAIELRGVLPPVPTPFGDDGEVAYDKLAENLERWNLTDLSGYLVTGSTGEFASLGEREKVRVWDPSGGGAGHPETREVSRERWPLMWTGIVLLIE